MFLLRRNGVKSSPMSSAASAPNPVSARLSDLLIEIDQASFSATSNRGMSRLDRYVSDGGATMGPALTGMDA